MTILTSQKSGFGKEQELSPATIAELKKYYLNSVEYREHLVAKPVGYFERYVTAVCVSTTSKDLILDLGCGTGESTDEIFKKNRRVIGTDLSNLFLGRQTGTGGARFVSADAVSLPFPSASFDVVGAMEFIEHVWPVSKVLSEMDRVLKPGGTIVLSSPNLVSPLRPVLDLPAILLKGQFRPPLYSSYGEMFKYFWFATRCTLRKLSSKEPQFLSRQPDLTQADSGGDFDAVYLSNARDISLFFANKGYKISYFSSGSVSLANKARLFPLKFFGSVWTSYVLCAAKPDRQECE
jgi:SAM-dependent methyltransferase